MILSDFWFTDFDLETHKTFLKHEAMIFSSEPTQYSSFSEAITYAVMSNWFPESLPAPVNAQFSVA